VTKRNVSHRSVSPIICIRELSEKHDDLLTDKAKLISAVLQEEEGADVIVIDVDTVAGTLNNREDILEKLPTNEALFILNRQKFMISLGTEACEGIYLEEIKRETNY